MMLGLLGLFYLLQLVAIYAAARCDYAPLASRSLSQGSMARWVTIAGTLYLPLCLLMAPIMPLGDASPGMGPLAVALRVGALALLAWPPLRGWLMERLHLDPQRSLHGLLLYFLFATVVEFGPRYLPYAMRGVPLPPVDNALVMKSLLGKLLMLAVALVAAGLGSKQGWRPVVERLDLRRRLGLRGVGIALFVLAVTMFSMQIVPDVVASLLAKLSWVTTPVPPILRSDSSLLWILLGTVGAGVIEELFFRGLLQPRLGIVGTSLLFTMVHVQYPVAALVGMFLTALLWGWVAKRYGLRASILVHILNNSLIYALALSPALMAAIFHAAPRAVCAAGFLWLAGYGIYRLAARQRAPFTPETRPWLAGLLGFFLLGGALCATVLSFASGPAGAGVGLIFWASGLALLLFLVSLPPVRRRLMRCLQLDPARWAHVLAFYALTFWALQGLLGLCLARPQQPWMFQGLPALVGEALTFSLFLSGLAALGVGAGLWRTKRRQVLERLGFQRQLPWTTWCLAPAFALLLLLAGYAFCWSYAHLALLGGGLAPPRLLSLAPAQLAALVPLLVPLCMHACTEELLFRGALQPRVGLVATSCVGALSGMAFLLRFYGLSPILLPFLLYTLASFGLGWIARKYGLGMSMLTSCLLYTGVFLACFL